LKHDYKGKSPNIHDDAWVHPDATIIGDVTLKRGANVWPGVVMRGDQGSIVIGEFSNVQDGAVAHATGGFSTVTIGDRVTVGHKAILHGCKVEDECLIGMGSILLDNCVIGAGSIVGAGALVPVGRVIPPNSLVLGNPGRVVKQVTEKHKAAVKTGCETYLRLMAEYKAEGVE